ncbi:hypothetical protein LCGC14_1552780 [marine sediment metagenome]|uniref:MAM domain-containing protein n=1 Tax=marine sediment metagenome TaxID=412755 RepID=A0A0F9JAU8_9ZZZZ
MAKKIWLGSALVLVVLTASFYILMPEKVRIDFTKTRTIFSVYNILTEKFDIEGIEYVRIFDGTKLMRAKNRTIDYTLLEGKTMAERVSMFKDGIVIEEKYGFDNDVVDVENVPTSHNICFTNAENKIFEYMIDRITYEGLTKDITSPFEFGKNMKLTFQDGYYRAKVYNYKYASDKIKIRYRVESDYQCFDVRFFDPVKEKKLIKTNYTYNTKLEEYDDGTGNAIIHSGMRYADSSGVKIEDAPSLKTCEFCDKIKLSIQEDKNYPVKVIDYNYTSITLDVQADTSELNKDIPLKVYNKENKTIYYEDTAKLTSVSEKKNYVIPFGFDKVIKWGENSTMIILNGTEGDAILEDDMFAEDSTRDGTQNFMFVDLIDGTGDIGFFKWDISIFIPKTTFSDVRACLWMGGGSNENIDVFYIANQTWEEGEIDALCGDGVYCPDLDDMFTTFVTTFAGDDVSDHYECFNSLESFVELEVNNSNTNFSFALNFSAGGDATDQYSFRTKEHTNTGQRNFMNFTFISPFLSLNITDPLENDAESVSENDNIIITFNFTDANDGSEKDSGVTVDNVTIGGNVCGFNDYCTGTPNACSTYGSEAACNTNASCSWDASVYFNTEFETFETDLGNWIATDGDPGCDFLRDQDGTPSASTGPQPQGSAPGANSTDFYMFVEASGGQCDNGEQAYLRFDGHFDLDTYPSTQLDFSYSMYGATMGTLNVQVNTSGTWSTYWTISGDQGISPVWTGKNLNFTPLSGALSVRFEYDRDGGAGFTGDIALDHINISQLASSSCSGTVDSCNFANYRNNSACTAGGCDLAKQNFTGGIGWQSNISISGVCFDGLSGLKDLYVNATFDGSTVNDTEVDAINYPSVDTCSPSSPLSADKDFDCDDTCVETGTLDCNSNSITTSNKGSGSIIFEQNPVNCVGVTLGCNYVTQTS